MANIKKSKSSHVEMEGDLNRDDLALLLQKELNKSNKNGEKISYFLDEDDNPSMITEWVSTGSTLLDLAISNRPNGGLPVGRLVELSGLEGCVTEDTIIEILEGDEIVLKKIEIKNIEKLLLENKKVKIKTKGNTFVPITRYVNKGILDTYEVILENGYKIKVSREHKFFTNAGWVELKDLLVEKHFIYCDNDEYSKVTSVSYVGKYKIVDVTVDSEEHSYYGNGMLNHNTGKSLICAQLISETQKKGGLSVFFDSEFAVDKNFWQVLGVDIKNVNYVPFTTLEEFFNKLELCIGAFRKANKDRLLTIFVDSVAQASTETEMESEHGVDGYNTSKSIIISKAMRKITGLISRQRILIVFTNQVRYNMNAGPFQEKWIVSGGKALSFACSVRIRLQNIGKIKDSKKLVAGMECQAQVIKNRCGPNYRFAAFDIMYDSGIQDLASWLYYMKTNGLISGDAKRYEFKRKDGTLIDFKPSTLPAMLKEDSSLKEEIYNTICENYIMKYKEPNSKIDEDIERTNTENDDITANVKTEE